MSPALRRDIEGDAEYRRCGLLNIHGHICGGRITRSHDVFVAGKKVQRKWAIPPLCAKGHGVDHYQDAHTEESPRLRLWVALNRATDEELMEYPKARLIEERERLNKEFGVYVPPPIPYEFVLAEGYYDPLVPCINYS